LNMEHDIWRFGALGRNAYRVCQHLVEQGPSTSANRNQELALGKRAVRGLKADLDETARLRMVAPKRVEQQARTLVERQLFRAHRKSRTNQKRECHSHGGTYEEKGSPSARLRVRSQTPLAPS